MLCSRASFACAWPRGEGALGLAAAWRKVAGLTSAEWPGSSPCNCSDEGPSGAAPGIRRPQLELLRPRGLPPPAQGVAAAPYISISISYLRESQHTQAA
jgi:hypothetical protein